MKKPLILAGFIFLTSLHAQTGNTGINTTAPKATLDVNLPSNYTNGQLAGVTIPQLTGDQIEAMSAATPKVGTIVYATAVSTATTKDVTAVGYWYWKDATDKWEPFTLGTSASGNTVDWSVNGNSGTAAANYLGTKDSQPLNFKTNANTDTNPKMTILPNGNVGVGTSNPTGILHLAYDGGAKFGLSDDMVIQRTHSNGDWAPISFLHARGTIASPQPLQKGDNLGLLFDHGYLSNGSWINGLNFLRTIYEGDGTNNLSSLYIGTSGIGRMKIDENGNIGVATSNPLAKLHIDGAADNPATGTPTAAQQANDVVVTNDGSVGMGTSSPTARLELKGRTFKLGQTVDFTDANFFYRPIIESNGQDLLLSTPRDDSGFVKIQDANSIAYFGINSNGSTKIEARGTDGARSTVSMDIESLMISDNPFAYSNSGKTKLYVSGKIKAENLVFTGLPTYATEAAADADATLVSGSLYKLSTGRQVYIKP